MNSNVNRSSLAVIGVQGKSTPSVNRGFFLPSPLLIVGGTALMFGISTMMFFNLWKGVIDDFATYRAQVEAAAEAVNAENERRIAAANKNAKEVGIAHANAMGVLARSYNSRLVGLQSACRAPVPRLTAAGTRTNGIAANDRLDPSRAFAGADKVTTLEAAAAKLELDAAVTAVKLVYLQDHVSRVCK